LREEVRREAGKVIRSLAERWQHDRKHAEAIEQVAAEATGGDLLLKVPVGRGYHSDVDCSCHFVADAFESTFLQHAQQLSLEVERDLANLIQKQRPAVRRLKPAGTVAQRTGLTIPRRQSKIPAFFVISFAAFADNSV
jgi:hypothetical protein